VRKFLGFSFTIGKAIKRRLAPQTLARFKTRVRELTRRTSGKNLAQIVEELARYLRMAGLYYFSFCQTPSVLRELDQGIRRRLRAIAWKQWTNGRTRFAELTSRGVACRETAGSPHGLWRLSNSPALAIAFPNAALDSLGLPSLILPKADQSTEPPCTDPHAGGVGGVAP